MKIRSSKSLGALAALSISVALAGCGSGAGDDAASGDGAITSNDGTALELRFQGQVLAPRGDPARQSVVAQLQYVQGTLTTAHGANGQVGLVTLADVVVEDAPGDKSRIRYSASLPVIWPKGSDAPKTYDLVLPADVTALSAFNDKYDGKCGTNEYGRSTFWHDFNPSAEGCKVDDADAARARADVRPHPKTTQNKYPEYDKIWADDALDIVGVFGVISSSTLTDAGAREMENVMSEIARLLTNPKRTENEAKGSILRDASVTGEVTLAGRVRKVTMTGLFTAGLSGQGFDDRYGPLSAKADFIVYSGHSGLGANIKAMSEKSLATKGKYQVVFLNGCQTFAYLGTELRDRRIALNADDPEGTKYLDVIANALPAFVDNGVPIISMARAMIASDTAPKSYNELLTDFSRSHLVAVFGEEDNAFKP